MAAKPHTFEDSLAEMAALEAEDDRAYEAELARERDQEALAVLIYASIRNSTKADASDAAEQILAAGWTRPAGDAPSTGSHRR